MIRRLSLLLALVASALAGPVFAGSKPLVTIGGQTRQLPAGTTLSVQPSTTGAASINIPHGTAPTSPVDGDCWTSTVGMYCRINGATVGPLAPGPAVSPNLTIRSNISGSSGVALDNTATAVNDAVYCSTVGRQIVRQSGAWTCAKGIPADPTWWGADPTGTTDSTAAAAAAYAAAGYVRFPPGKFKFSSASTFNISGTLGSAKFEGSGADVTTFYFPTTAGWTFQLSGQGQSVHLADFSITTGTTNVGSALTIQNSATFIGTFVAQSDVTRVTCRGDDGYGVNNYWTTCFNIVATTDVTFDGVNAYGDSTALHGTGIAFSAPSGGPTSNCLSSPAVCGTTYLISKANFSFLGVGVSIGTNTQSVSLDTSFIAQVENGIVVQGTARTLQGLNVTNLHCFAYRRCIIGLSSQPNFQIVGGYMNVASGYYAIDLPSAQGTITGVTFFPRDTVNPINSGAIAIRAPTSTCSSTGAATCAGPIVIDSNSYTSVTTGTLIDPTVTMVRVGSSNAYNSLTTNVIDNGTGNLVGALVQISNGRVGYAAGAGGTVTQATSKSTAVTLNRPTGVVTTNNAALAGGAEIGMTLNNTVIGPNDLVYPQVGNGNYDVRTTDCTTGSCVLRLKNLTGGSLSDAVAITFAVIAGSTN